MGIPINHTQIPDHLYNARQWFAPIQGSTLIATRCAEYVLYYRALVSIVTVGTISIYWQEVVDSVSYTTEVIN